MPYTGPFPFTNNGTITGVLVSSTSFHGSVVNNGKITLHGIVVTHSTISGQITKPSGTIIGGISLDANSKLNSASTGAAVLVEGPSFAGGISNGGTIVSGNLYGIDVGETVLNFTGGITNSGAILAGLAGIYLVNSLTFTGGITNSGTILGNAYGTSGTGILIFENVSFRGGITNSGTISGLGDGINVSGASGNGVSIFDSGIISGSGGTAINFGSDINTLTLAPGYSITGNVTGSSSNNIFQLGGNGGGSFDLGRIGSTKQYQDFSTFDVIGGDWLASNAGNQSWTVSAGTFELGTSASIAGTVTFAGAGATLQFDANDNQVSGSIVGAVAGDAIDLHYLGFGGGDHTSWQQVNGSSGLLSLYGSNGDLLAQFSLQGQYQSSYFTALSDNNGGTLIEVVNPPVSAGTTADMIMSNPSNGAYEIYDIGGDTILAAYSLDQIASPLAFVGLGDFSGTDTADMLLRDTSTGSFQAYYISGNTVTSSALVGTVGVSGNPSQNWAVAGIGNFDGASSLSELLLRNSGSGAFELYQVQGGSGLVGSAVAAVGNNLQVSGFGNFSGSTTTQMIMEQANEAPGTNAYWLYTYNPSAAAFAGHVGGTVGNNLSVVGFGDLLGNGETQMVMQQNNGNYWLYTYQPSTNSLSGTLVGAIGSNFHVVGFGQLGTSGRDEMLMQDAAGDFEVYQYNASLNAFVGNSMGTVGAPWVVDGIAADPLSGSGAAGSASTAQLVQAMASMGAGAPLNTAPGPTVGANLPQPTLLTTPHPA